VNSGGAFTGVQICEDTVNSYLTDAITDRITLPTSTLINNAAQSRKAVCGWFSVTGIQNPPKSIYGEGNATQSLRFILGWGNNLVFEVDSADFTLQIFGDVPLEINRPYHLAVVFEGNGFSNEFRAYLDGVKQLSAEPTARQPNVATLAARSVGEFGGPAGTVAVGGTAVVLLSPINGQYAQWAMFDGASAVLTDTQIRQELFEKGAMPTTTITNQAGLDALADTVRGDTPLSILVNVTGSIALTADNVTFNPLCSIHVQYNGTGTLTWTNINGANASIGSTTSTGSIAFVNPATLTINGVINGAEVRIYDDETTPGDNNFDTELDGIESNVGTSFTFSHDGSVNTIIIQMMASGYEEVLESFQLSSVNQTLTLFPKVETND